MGSNENPETLESTVGNRTNKSEVCDDPAGVAMVTSWGSTDEGETNKKDTP